MAVSAPVSVFERAGRARWSGGRRCPDRRCARRSQPPGSPAASPRWRHRYVAAGTEPPWRARRRAKRRDPVGAAPTTSTLTMRMPLTSLAQLSFGVIGEAMTSRSRATCWRLRCAGLEAQQHRQHDHHHEQRCQQTLSQQLCALPDQHHEGQTAALAPGGRENRVTALTTMAPSAIDDQHPRDCSRLVTPRYLARCHRLPMFFGQIRRQYGCDEFHGHRLAFGSISAEGGPSLERLCLRLHSRREIVRITLRQRR